MGPQGLPRRQAAEGNGGRPGPEHFQGDMVADGESADNLEGLRAQARAARFGGSADAGQVAGAAVGKERVGQLTVGGVGMKERGEFAAGREAGDGLVVADRGTDIGMLLEGSPPWMGARWSGLMSGGAGRPVSAGPCPGARRRLP
jgi:hypothetical protein